MTTSPPVGGPSLAVTKQRREQLGISQAALAREVGITRQQLNHIEAGRRRASDTVAAAIAQRLGITPEQVSAPQRIPGMLTTAEAAHALRVHEHTLIRWARSGAIEGRKVGRKWLFPTAAVTAACTDGLEVAS